MLQRLLAGPPAGADSKAVAEKDAAARRALADPLILDQIAPVITAWRQSEARLAQRLSAGQLEAGWWRPLAFDDHVIRGTALLPGAGWLVILADLFGNSGASSIENGPFIAHISSVRFLKGLTTPLHVTARKRRATLSMVVGAGSAQTDTEAHGDGDSGNGNSTIGKVAAGEVLVEATLVTTQSKPIPAPPARR